MPAVLVLGTYRQTLTVVRSLARAGQKIVLGVPVHGDAATCDHSRYVSEIWHHPDPRESQNDFFHALIRLLEKRDEINAIIPVGETDIRLLMPRYRDLSAHAKLLMCDPGLVATCLEKSTMSAIVDSLGIPQARHITATDCDSLFLAADTIGYPCVVKLSDSEFLLHGEKARIYETANALRKDFSAWPIPEKSLIVQSYVPSDRMNLYFYALRGQITSLGQVRALRTDRVNGTGLSVAGLTVAPDAVLVDHCQTIVRHLNYTGVGCMQFLVNDANGTTSFLEHNPRLGAGFVLPYVAGLDLPLIMLNNAIHEQAIPTAPTYPCKVGVRYVWTTGDIKGLKRAIQNRELGLRGATSWLLTMAKANLTTRNHVSWDWRDPLPTIVQVAKALESAAKSLLPGKPG